MPWQRKLGIHKFLDREKWLSFVSLTIDCKTDLQILSDQLDLMFNNSINGFTLDPNFVLDFSYSRSLQATTLSSGAAPGLQPGGSGHSVQMLNPPGSGYLVQQATGQSTARPSRLLDDFSISHLPPTKGGLTLVEQLNINKQQMSYIETVRFKATESLGVGRRMSSMHKETCVLGTGNSNRAKYNASEKYKKVRARYLASDKGKANLARSRAKYAASGKGKANKARSRAKYAASDKGKAKQLIRSARYRAYRAALKKGFSEELAREKGELAADNKKAEISSVSPWLINHNTNPDIS